MGSYWSIARRHLALQDEHVFRIRNCSIPIRQQAGNHAISILKSENHYAAREFGDPFSVSQQGAVQDRSSDNRAGKTLFPMKPIRTRRKESQ